MTDLATIGFKANTDGLTKAQTELKKTAAAGATLDKSMSKAEKSTKKTADSMSGFGRKAGMAGIQVEQLVGSINAGQNPMRALGFQATDLGYVLGFPLVGAIVGISASIGSTLIPALLSGTEATEKFKFEVGELTKDLKTLEGLSRAQAKVAVDELNKSMNALSKEAEEQGEKIAKLNKQLDDNARTTRNGRRLVSLSADERKKLTSQLNLEQAQLDKINKKYKIQSDALVEVTAGTKGIVSGTGEKNKALSELNTSLLSQINILNGVAGAEQAAFEVGVLKNLGVKELDATTQSHIDTLFAAKQAIEDEAAAQKKANEDKLSAAKELSDMQKLISQVDDFGGAWSRTGSVMIDAFGGMADALDDYQKKMEGIAELQSDLNDKKEEYKKAGKSTIEIDAASAKLNDKALKSQVGGYADLAGATSSFFDKKTSAYKAAHAIEMTLSAVEIAMSLKKTAISVTAGAAKMFEQSGWAGFAGVAAMGAVMAGLGYSMSGGGGSATAMKYNDGTGSVLGDDDAVSESVEASKDLLDVGLDQLSELRGIRDAVSAVDNATASLTSEILLSDYARDLFQGEVDAIYEPIKAEKTIATGGKVTGLSIDSGVVSSIVDIYTRRFTGKSNFLGTTSTTTDAPTELASSVQNIIDSIKGATKEGLKSLDLGISESIIDAAELSIGNIDIEGLDGEELQEVLNGVFSSAADTLILDIAPELRKYQESGTGLLETLTKLSLEQATFNDALDIMGNSLGDLSAIMQIDIAQSVIELTGGLEEFSDLVGVFFSEFLSEEDQFTYTTKSLTEALKGLGVGLFESRDGFTYYMEALDLTDEAQKKIFTGLLELLPALDNYYDEIEKNQESATKAELALINEAKNARLSALQTEQSLLSNVVSRFLPSAQNAAITALSALNAARKGDFSQANRLSVPALSASDYSSNVNYMIAQAQQSATLAEIGRLASEQLSEVDTQISLLDEQNNILTEINNNVIAQNTAATSTQNTQTAENNAKMTEMQTQQQSVNEAMARNISGMANDINTIKNNGVAVFTLGDDVLSVASV